MTRVDGKKMTEEELKEKIADKIWNEMNIYEKSMYDIASSVLTLIREAGWKSPDEVKEQYEIGYCHGLLKTNEGQP